MIISVARDAVHLGGMLVPGISRQIILRHLQRFVVLFLNDVNLCDVVRCECLVLGVVLQSEKSVQSFPVSSLCIADIREVVVAVFRIAGDRKSTRLNSSHANISYAVFCLKKKNTLCPASIS